MRSPAADAMRRKALNFPVASASEGLPVSKPAISAAKRCASSTVNFGCDWVVGIEGPSLPKPTQPTGLLEIRVIAIASKTGAFEIELALCPYGAAANTIDECDHFVIEEL